LLPLASITTGSMDAAETNGISAEKRQQVGQQFEGMFMSLLLKEMRQTVGEGGLFAGESSDTLGGMFDMFMSDHLSQQGGLGIGQMIETYLENSV
ncbi:MAG: rod-binding protein, partial [Planctomycetales bacterium]|nr:rod-binding protein [Planctomycetales bacterium]